MTDAKITLIRHGRPAVLSSRASEFGHVALLTHGYFLRFLQRALEASGWHGSTGRALGYWSHSHFERALPAGASDADGRVAVLKD